MTQSVGSLSAYAVNTHLEVVAEQGFVVWMRAVFDDALGALYGVETAEVSDTLVCYDNVYRVL